MARITLRGILISTSYSWQVEYPVILFMSNKYIQHFPISDSSWLIARSQDTIRQSMLRQIVLQSLLNDMLCVCSVKNVKTPKISKDEQFESMWCNPSSNWSFRCFFCNLYGCPCWCTPWNTCHGYTAIQVDMQTNTLWPEQLLKVEVLKVIWKQNK